ncbi:MAG: glucokinase [Bacteroidetes bacterium]|nr:glucokinase [Bacteroidota bacterium]
MSNQSRIPLAFSRESISKLKSINVLAGDVGGTKTNLALYRATENEVTLICEKTFHSADFSSATDVVKKFLSQHEKISPFSICLGVAGPVFQGKVEMPNLSWSIDADDLRSTVAAQSVSLINDLEATAYGLAALGDDDLITVHSGAGDSGDNMAIIAPGTGLGEAGLYWNGSGYHPFPTEGGHTDFSPRTELDIELLRYLSAKYEIVSWERVIAGPGIHDIYLFLRDQKNRKEQDWVKELLRKDDPSAVISQAGLDETDPTCIETMQLYVQYLARESSNLVLKMKATGGLFLGGGIPPKISSLLQQDVFYDNFIDCDRMQHLIRKTPVKIILNSKTALLGAAYFGAYGA